MKKAMFVCILLLATGLNALNINSEEHNYPQIMTVQPNEEYQELGQSGLFDFLFLGNSEFIVAKRSKEDTKEYQFILVFNSKEEARNRFIELTKNVAKTTYLKYEELFDIRKDEILDTYAQGNIKHEEKILALLFVFGDNPTFVESVRFYFSKIEEVQPQKQRSMNEQWR